MNITYDIEKTYKLYFPVDAGLEELSISRCVSFLIGITSASLKHPRRFGLKGIAMYKMCDNDQEQYVLDVHTDEDLTVLFDELQGVMQDISDKISTAWK